MDLMAPGSEGIEGLRMIKRLSPISSIIVHTFQHDQNMIKRFGTVFDIIQKPSELMDLLETIARAMDFKISKEMALTKEKTSEEDLKEELEWLLWREQNLMNSRSSYGKTILETLVHSIFQGRGLGGMMSLMEMVELTKKETEDEITISKELYNLLMDNLNAVQIMKTKLDKTIHIFDINFHREPVTGDEISDILEEEIKNVSYLLDIKHQTIRNEKHNFTKSYVGNKEFLKIAFRELVTNAIKYSPDNSVIYTFLHKKESNSISIIVLNSILKIPRGISGIPQELEHEVFVPFFKINNVHDDRFFQEELGLGIGLSVVQTGVTKIGGKLRIYEIMDHVLSKVPEKKICTELILPIFEEE